jgi:predicted nucleic acid-binding protein
MIVVADTTPLNYLILIGHVDILRQEYGRVLIPRAVHDEMLHGDAPPLVRAWATNPPEWLEIVSLGKPLPAVDTDLDRGEAEAIELAEQLHSTWLLMDEAAGRKEAMRRGLQTVGTLWILRNAHMRGTLNLHVALAQLEESGFRMSETLVRMILNSIEKS